MGTFEHTMMLSITACMNRCMINFHTMRLLLLFTYRHIALQNACEVASKRRHRNRVKWVDFNKLLSDTQFRRYFRMDRLCFKKLCDAVEQAVGEEAFMSKHFINTLPLTYLHKKHKMMHED